jgi:hypothetical protein
MINLLHPTDNGILDNRPVGERDPTLPRLIRCENPHDVLSLIEDFSQYKDDLGATKRAIVEQTQTIFYHLEMMETCLQLSGAYSSVQEHLDQLREAAGELFALGDA